jgi:hypothetical protein
MPEKRYRSGLWPSKISAESTLLSKQMQYPEFYRGQLTWVEPRFREGGRKVLVIQQGDGSQRTVTPDGFNLRSRVHEYGGRAHAFAGDQVVFVNFEDQAIYIQPMDGGPAKRLSAAAPEGEEWRFADLVMLPSETALIAVCEIHVPNGEPRNLLVHLKLEPMARPHVLHQGADFVAMPTISAAGTELAWIQWDHPHMQWDCSELWTGTLHLSGDQPALRNCSSRAGGPGRSVWQPLFLRQGGLVFAMDEEGSADPTAETWQLYLTQRGETLRLTHGRPEFAEPFWLTGARR